MKPKKLLLIVNSIALLVLLIHGVSHAQWHSFPMQSYNVTITNITRGQIISPPIIISHNRDFELFTLGTPAIPALVALAEDGQTQPLADYVASLPTVLEYQVSLEPIMPGASVTLTIAARRGFNYISAAGMLVTTNDAFFAARGIRVPRSGVLIVESIAYDAGSEVNSESCMYIPGPPCGNGGVRDADGAEGYVHVHAGIHGITGDLTPAVHDWRNPVAKISIQRAH